MSHDEKLAALEAERKRQDEELADFEAAMTALKGFDIEVPDALLRELDAATEITAPAVAAGPTILGALRA